MLGELLAGAGGGQRLVAVEPHGNGEFGRVVGAFAFGLDIGRRLEPPALRPFLQRGLGVGAPAGRLAGVVPDPPLDDLEGRAEAAIDLEGAEHRLHHVA